MVATCKALGITPLTKEEWDEDNRRMVLEYKNRHRATTFNTDYGQLFVSC